ncbi:MAG TPA: 2-C-methyl-D-erythritol 4-phosphate cytidylyltransferase [Ktedonobacterales bacterium]
MPTLTERQPGTIAVLLALSPWAWERHAEDVTAAAIQEAFAACGVVDGLVLAPPDRSVAASLRWGRAFHQPISPDPDGPALLGPLRMMLRHGDPSDIMLIHDAAWPLVTPELIGAVREKAIEHGAAIAVGPVKETIKQVRDGLVVGTLARESLAQVQWPAALTHEAAKRVLAVAPGLPPDTPLTALLFAAGIYPAAVLGPPENTGIRSAADLAVAEALLARR